LLRIRRLVTIAAAKSRVHVITEEDVQREIDRLSVELLAKGMTEVELDAKIGGRGGTAGR